MHIIGMTDATTSGRTKISPTEPVDIKTNRARRLDHQGRSGSRKALCIYNSRGSAHRKGLSQEPRAHGSQMSHIRVVRIRAVRIKAVSIKAVIKILVMLAMAMMAMATVLAMAMLMN